MSDVWLLTRRNAVNSLRRQQALLLLIVAFVVGALTCDGVIGAGVAAYAQTVQYRSALNLIQISAVSPQSRHEINDQTLASISKIPKVTGIYPWFQVDLALADSTDFPGGTINPGALWGTPLVPGLAPKVLLGRIPENGLTGNQIALPHAVPGGVLDPLLGQQVTMEFTKVIGPGQGVPERRKFLVVAIFDNSVADEAGLTPSYLSQATLTQLATASGSRGGAAPTYSLAYVRVGAGSDVPEVQQLLSERGFGVASVATQLESLTGLFRVLSWARSALLALLLLFGLAIGSSIGATWVQHRTREVGLLKAMGWGRSRIAVALVGELGLVGIAAGVASTLLGTALSLGTTAVVAREKIELLPLAGPHAPAWLALGLSLVVIPLCICLGGLRSLIRASSLDADEALRDL